MQRTRTIIISGGFHNASAITLKAKIDPRGGIYLSHGQAKRLSKHMCGVKGCICGMYHGWGIDGVSRNDLSEALMEAHALHCLNSERSH